MTDRPWDEPPQPGDADVTREIPRPGYGSAGQGAPGGYPGQGAPGGYSGQGAPGGYPEQGTPGGYPEQGTPGGYPDQGGPPPDPVPEEEAGSKWLVPLLAALGALVAGLVLGWLIFSGGDDSSELEAEVDRLTAANADLEAEVEDLTAELEAQGTAGEDRVAELTAENEGLAADVDALTEEVAGLTTDNEDLTEQVADLEADNTRLQERIDEILADFDEAMVATPDLVGGTSEDAATVAEENGWLLVQIPSATDQVDAGTVVAQTPPSGTPMLSGAALVVSVASEPDPAPDPEAETVFDAEGTGPATTDVAELAGGTRHVLAYSFTGDGEHTVSVVDADDNEVAVLVEVNGTAEGATGLPLAGSYRLQVETGDSVDWNLRVVALP
ncbi:PASTA domain-containing protein [Ornithinimicrobium sp. F0845]|uniref:PASTA domain-containing protein n=1 Tax=Ornithinimicrobium sp. F0845 TaxID=2926412 RepID=UPI001FF3F872|nr:PASTA domain-containing protein [Ornithinimicrobium sp. F0845]MCK0112942.1 PASTA domain-containing protein [Ornithinimicrobium sp. F0845]